MVKKMPFGLATVMLATTVLAACSGGGKEAGGHSAAPAASASGSASGSAAPTSKKADKVYIYDIGLAAGLGKASKPEAVQRIRDLVKQQTGIEIEVVPRSVDSPNEKLNLVLASNDPLDIFVGSMDTHQLNGAVMPLNSLLDKYGANIRKQWKPDWKIGWDALTTPDGKIWAIPTTMPWSLNRVMIRKDWLTKLNLPMPKTFDEFEKVLQAFKDKDPAGNGQTIPLLTDHNPSAGMNGMNGSMAAGFMAAGYGDWFDSSDGKVKKAVYDAGYKDFLALMADWYKKGLIFKESFTTNRDRQNELIKQSRVGAVASGYNLPLGTNLNELRKNDPNADYAVVDLQGPKGMNASGTSASRSGIMLNKNAQNPEAAMRLLDWIFADIKNYFLLFFGIENDNYKYIDKAANQVQIRLNYDYLGDLLPFTTLAYTVQSTIVTETPLPGKVDYADWMIKNYVFNPATSKPYGIANVDYQFDRKAIAAKVPNMSDIDKTIDQEIVKFVMGARPLAEYDKFLAELGKAGHDVWSAAMTEEYKKYKK